MWRKTIVATALIGAGLGSTAGMAFAGEAQNDDHGSWSKDHGDHGKGHGHHGDRDKDSDKGGKSCDNEVAAAQTGETSQRGLVNVDDVQTIIPVNACNNNIPVNVLGVQVPVQDSDLNLPILSGVTNGANRAG